MDQTTYTAFDKLYPDGTYFWRVQAMDDENQGQAWSQVQTFTKTSPPVVPISPVSGASVPGTTPFRWSAAPFASSYTVEAYRNHDLTFSSANRMFSATVKTTAFVPPTPLAALSSSYVWRVRRTDASGNPGPWSTPQSFLDRRSAPLLTPKTGVYLSNQGALFEWTEVPGATSYALNLAGAHPAKVATSATAWAPTGQIGDGEYTWNVTALDAARNVLGTSIDRSFRVDAHRPRCSR